MRCRLYGAIIALTPLMLVVVPNVAAQDITTDPFIQGAVNKENWMPGGVYYGFTNRGTVVEQTGDVDVVPLYSQTMGNFKLQNADIHGNLSYVIDITGHHPHSDHSPFDSRTESRASDRRDSPDGTQSSYDMRWTGTFVHPSNGYDGPQGGGYPVPHRLGAVDLVSYNIEGIATGIYPLSQSEIQQRDVTRQSERDASTQQSVDRAVGYYSDAFTSVSPDFSSPLNLAKSAGNFAIDSIKMPFELFLGLANTSAAGYNYVGGQVGKGFDYVSDNTLTYSVSSIRPLDIRSQYEIIDTLGSTSEYISSKIDPVKEEIQRKIVNFYENNPRLAGFLIEDVPAVIGIFPGGYIIAKKFVGGKIDIEVVNKNNDVNIDVATARDYSDIGFNNSREWRDYLDKTYGAENVTSTTIAPINKPNVKLAGQNHPVTGVPFDNKGFPIFDNYAEYDIRFPLNQFNNSDYTGQMRMATRDLRDQISKDPILRSKFSPIAISAIERGESKIPGYTWHHHQDMGRMQLVDEFFHNKTGHIGGEAMSEGR